jgi:hypothetical protein
MALTQRIGLRSTALATLLSLIVGMVLVIRLGLNGWIGRLAAGSGVAGIGIVGMR